MYNVCVCVYAYAIKIYKNNICLFIIILNSSIADIKHSSNYTAFGLQQMHQMR